MFRTRLFFLAITVLIQCSLSIAQLPSCFAQVWEFRVKPRGTLKVADFFWPPVSMLHNYAEGLVTLDKENQFVPCLAKDLRWIDQRTLEFKLRKDVKFHNGEDFNAEVVSINWEEYKKLQAPRPVSDSALPDETVFKKMDDYTVRFILPEPDGFALVKFQWFFQIAPSFYKRAKMTERQWGYLPKAGPWGTGPFELREGSIHYAKNVDLLVLEAYEHYWDPRYPKVQRVVFDNTLLGNRKEAMRLCGDQEGSVDIINRIRPLDTLKLAGSKYAKVLKNRDVAALRGIFNQRKTGSKWQDLRVRKAINYAINREELWKYSAKGNSFNL
jgi:peptide/nickel transport system substrate-binding protein